MKRMKLIILDIDASKKNIQRFLTTDFLMN